MGFVKYMSGIMVENPLPVGGFLYELSDNSYNPLPVGINTYR